VLGTAIRRRRQAAVDQWPEPHQATFTCYFDNYGRVVDSSYQLY
jgi:hypothetical protein